MKLLGNSSQGISPIQKHLLYKCCILLIALYSFQLWFYNKALISYHMKILNKMQRRVAIWILGAFKTLPSMGIEAIAGIILIKFHLQKIAKRLEIRSLKLPLSHLLRSLMDDSPSLSIMPNPHHVGSLTNCQILTPSTNLSGFSHHFLPLILNFHLVFVLWMNFLIVSVSI